jgi:GNAT superfamily N-acetyltransferase
VAPPRLHGVPLARFERDGLKAALKKAGLPTENVDEPDILFWRFESREGVPVGFGGLEIHDRTVELDEKIRADLDRLGISRPGASLDLVGRDALLHSLVTLPPLRRKGFGAAIVAALELEARVFGRRAVYLLATDTALFVRLGYHDCDRKDVPGAIASSRQFGEFCAASAATMVKRIV